MEAFMYRAHPQAEAIHRLVREGAIGRVLHIQSSLAFASKFDPDRGSSTRRSAAGGSSTSVANRCRWPGWWPGRQWAGPSPSPL